jgi:hypothetical protein
VARYTAVWLEIARQQYESFSVAAQKQIDAKIDLLLENPEEYGDYDKASDQWTTTFGEGAGLIVYAVVRQNVKVIILRLVA